MDQWPNDAAKPKISKRFLYRLGKDKNGKFIDPPQMPMRILSLNREIMKIKSALAMVVALSCCSAQSAEQTIVCPTELAAESVRVAVAPKGWQPYVASPLYLHSAAPVAGPPERLATIIAKTKKSKSEWVETYNLDVKYPEGVYFTCSYGAGNEFVISKKLSADVKSCVVKGRKGEHVGQNAFDITCR